MILFLYGEDTFRSRQKLEEIRAKFLRDIDPTGLNLTSIESEKNDVNDVRAAVSASPFLAKRRLVILKNFVGSAKKKKEREADLAELFEKVPEETILVLYEAAGSEELGKGALFSGLKSNKFYPEFTPLQARALTSWIQEETTKRGGSFAPDALNAYAAVAGNDLWKVSTEIDKLVSCSIAARRPIDRPMLDDLVDARIEVTLFELMDAVGARKPDRAAAILDGLLEQGESEIMILNRLQGHFRTLLLCSDMAKHGTVTKERVTRDLGLHPFVASKAMSQARYFSTEELSKMYAWLIDADQRLKLGGWHKPRAAIDLFLLQSLPTE